MSKNTETAEERYYREERESDERTQMNKMMNKFQNEINKYSKWVGKPAYGIKHPYYQINDYPSYGNEIDKIFEKYNLIPTKIEFGWMLKYKGQNAWRFLY